MRLVIAFICLSGWAMPAAAQSAMGYTTPAPHAVIMDSETGIILFEKDARRPVAPASMTKILTAEIVFEAIRAGNITLDTEFEVSEEAWRRGGSASGSSTMFLKLGSKVAVKDLLRGVIVQSGNDACIVLAEGLAGSETAFADMMTEHARAAGLGSVTFRNATGWPHPEHRISTYDLAQLARRSIEIYPEFYGLYSERSFEWNGIRQSNRNPLLGKFTGADGLKTGHTQVSGYGLVGSAKRGDTRRIIVLNGLESKAERRDEALKSIRAAFDSFGVYKMYDAGAAVADVDVYMGQADTVKAVITADAYAGLYRSDRAKLKTQIRFKAAPAPIVKGTEIAQLIINEPGKPERVLPLVAANDVPRLGAFGRARRALLQKIRG